MKAIYETRYARIGETTEHYGGVKINGTDIAKQWAANSLAGYFDDRADQEEMLVVLMDTQLKPKRIVRITRGTLNASLVHPREVFRPAIQDSASSIMLVHQHPSGDVTPSREDIAVTQRIREAGQLIGIELIDHLIVGCGTGLVTSIREYQW